MNEPAAPPLPLRVLIVDDDTDSADTLAELVTTFGHDVRVTYEGHSALNVGRLWRPDVIFLDLDLPAMDGYEVARRMREEIGALARIVALSGFGRRTDVERSLSAGCDQHLVKPPHMGDILRVLSPGS
jgi:CheY-like chemotaxis protein